MNRTIRVNDEKNGAFIRKYKESWKGKNVDSQRLESISMVIWMSDHFNWKQKKKNWIGFRKIKSICRSGYS